MISIRLSENSFWENRAEGYFFLLEENFSISPNLKVIEKDCYPHLSEILKKHKFEGKCGQSFVLSGLRAGELVQFVFVGIGKIDISWDKKLDHLRKAIDKLVKTMKNLEIKSGVLSIPYMHERKDLKISEIVKQIAVSAQIANYEFTAFKADKKEEFSGEIILTNGEKEVLAEEKALIEEFLFQGMTIGKAMNMARHWADTPPNVLTPTVFAKEVEALAKSANLKYSVFGRDKAIELGMGGFACVDAGSDQDGKFIIVEYKSDVKNASLIGLVGKGVTFDSGGISLKPSAGMTGMKYDMCGAAAVMATIKAISEIKPDVDVVVVAPVVENMPSGKSSRQDDIVTFMNGKTAEIKSTDAEGRLILADALCYLQKFYKPTVIIDIATLTKAVEIALGHFYAGLLSRDEKLVKELEIAGQITGDKVWQLPLDDEYKPAIESDFADLSNTGKSTYGAGTITAGLFLENFVDKNIPWAHLDIAGVASDVPGIKGASGAGIRLLVEYILKHQ
ncbi:TPA: leucyl aminopeptidase [Candidatus Dependentiae bacterium]|nr:MAG: putative cytosol aminopeptidase [candidate division TM6 bacterium GW2011_GWE2_31_21]KKP53085.1 MAG: putative cytosol aminopeptidase [candidate division TM6 bacterium GW2011_GWF2_33_332]HBS47903.1 leucyl aminopeptidase [Candidatus Dependentiae bacterium]HBZ73493.1 leucyl aminopeptidase [Candidatus Dependentiae bacterium]